MTDIKKRFSFSQIIINVIFVISSIACVVPVITVISVSFSKESDIYRYGYRIIIKEFTTLAYEYLFKNPEQIINSYFVTTFVSFVGMFLSLLVMSAMAYPLSRLDFRHRNKISFFLFFTMLFSGGMVPWYMVVSGLHINNTLLVLILPYLVNPWYVFLLRTFMQTISKEIVESAYIDGARELRIFLTIILPLSKPGLASVGIFILLAYWNDWWLAMMFITKDSLLPLQYLLARIMANIQFLTENISNMPSGVNRSEIPGETIRMAVCVIAAGPMLFIFPFFQKYFTKGLTVGAIKG